jgi:DNA-binding MarR family transcriptional regulator
VKVELLHEDFLSSILRSQLRVLRAVRAIAASEDLTLQQFGVLRILSQREGVASMNVLGDELMVKPPVITGIIDRLETKGLVKREESTTDRRKTEIVLTDVGKKAHRKIREDYRHSLRESLARSLTPAEQENLARLMARFVEEIRIE